MARKRGFALYCYTLSPNSPPAIVEYSAQVMGLTLVSQSPGGMGSLECTIALKNARLPRPELSVFARVALMDASMPGPEQCVFIGEVSDAELGMTRSEGEYVRLTALGIGATLRDDPRVMPYSGKTAQQIVNQEISDRAAYLVIDTDNLQVFPDNPATTYSPAYPGRTMEEVVQDQATLAGDYSWGVWPHQQHKDTAGFPTGQLVVHLRDTATVAYTASVSGRDVEGYRITPSTSRAYNYIALGYNDPNQTNAIGFVFYKDPRLAANNSQGTAPFRYRKYYRDTSGVTTVQKATAQSIANAFGAQYQNVTNTIELTLKGVRDANGNPIPLWQVRADKNIFVPELAVRGTQLVTTPTAGVNLFYIRQARYVEDKAGDTYLVLTCDTFFDRAEQQLARLQLAADILARAGANTTGPVQAQGAPFKGVGGGVVNPTSGTTATAVAVTFAPTTLFQAPTSIGSFTAINVSNANSPSATNLTQYGFLLNWNIPSTTSVSTGFWSYITAGNCLVEVDEDTSTFAHHCPKCEAAARERHGCLPGCADCREAATYRGHSIKGARVNPTENGLGLRVHRRHADPKRQAMHVYDDAPGKSALAWDCPSGCGYWESHDTSVGPEDEDAAVYGAHHAEQARLIRRLMRALRLPTREEVRA